MRVAGGEGTRIIRILPGLPTDSRQAGVQLDAERHKVKRNHFADVRHYVEGYDPTSGIFRRLTHPILGWLPHPILDWAIITEKPGLMLNGIFR